MPTYLACCYLFSGAQFSMANWMPPVFVQCLVSALTGVFVALTATCVFNKRVGLLAGILCAVYPAFIINTNRLYGETFAACLVSAICFLTVRGTLEAYSAGRSCAMSFASGLVTAVLQNTRSIMFLLTLLVIPFSLSGPGRQRRILAFVGFLLGFAIIAAPWLAFQKLLNSSSGLVQDRGWQ